jgi:hypothetical protein
MRGRVQRQTGVAFVLAAENVEREVAWPLSMVFDGTTAGKKDARAGALIESSANP